MKHNVTKQLRRSLLLSICLLTLLTSQALLSQTTVNDVSPQRNALNVPPVGTILVAFSGAILPASFNDMTSFVVRGSTSGRHLGSFSFLGGNTVAMFTPTVPYMRGERVVVDISSNLLNASSVPITPFVYSFTIGVNSSNGAFATKVDYETGSGPVSVFVSDVDGDGDGDLAVANRFGNTVSIMKNNGDGTYGTKVDYTTGNAPFCVFVNDVDGDGDGDLAVTNFSDQTVSILKNNGDGTYGSKVDYATGINPWSVFISDVDGDGDGDLVVANASSSSVSVLKNNGDGTYAAKVDYTTGADPKSLFVSDVDNDGDGDIVTPNASSNTVSILKNNGDGTYAAKVDYTTGSDPFSVFVSDVDNDGDGDLAVANYGSNTVSVLKNNGDGTFAAKMDYATGTNPVSVFISDVDGDSDGDIAAANYGSSTTSILKNNGDGTFATKTDYAVGNVPFSVFISDVDGDGVGDVAVANYGSNSVSILKGNVPPPIVTSVAPADNALNVSLAATIQVTFSEAMLTGSFNDMTSFVVRGMTSGRHLGSFGFTGGNTVATFTPTVPFDDGEIVVVDISSNLQSAGSVALIPYVYSFTVVAAVAPGTFTGRVDYTVGSQPRSVFVHDLDGDGDGDIVAANGGSYTVSILKNNGDGTFEAKVDYVTGGYSTSVFVSDLDGDGDGDLAVANAYDGNTVSILKNNGDATFAPKVDYLIGSGSNGVFVSDIDGDGDGDVLTVSGSGTASVLMNNGDGTLQPRVDYATTAGSTPNYIYLSDVDGDGDADLLVGNQSGSSSVSVFKNNGDGTFGAKVDYSTGVGEIGPLVVSDVDGDGDGDIVISNQTYNHISVLKNNGDGTFAVNVDYPTGGNPVQVFVSDLDGDGDGDIAVPNAASYYISILKNNGDGTFSPKVDYITGSSPQGLFVSDLDGDGDGDIVTGNYGSGNVTVLKNDYIMYTLTVNIVGNGSVTKLPDQPTYITGSTVQLDPVPSVGYVFAGWSGNASGTDDPLDLLMDGDKDVTATFTINPDYEIQYRTASYTDWATAIDGKGKYKALKRKNNKVLLKFNIGAPANATGFTLKFSMPVRGAVTLGKSKSVQVGDSIRNTKEATFSSLSIAVGDTFQFDGWGSMGKKASVKVAWATSPKVITQTVTGFKNNDPGLPMPNLHNVGVELFPGGFGQASAYFTNGLLVGIPQGIKGARSVRHIKYTDVLASLVKVVHGVPVYHADSVRCLDTFTVTRKPILKQQKSLPPDKGRNILFAELLALKLNVAASATAKFPPGLGELTFNDETDPANPFNGQLVSTIVQKADTVISCLPLFSKVPPPTLVELYNVLKKINGAFAGTIDSISFAAKTSLTGVKQLIDVPFLRKTPGVEPIIIASDDMIAETTPVTFLLNQNYPNPFNPTTTIGFDLPASSIVTLKIYNMLGQEVAKLIDGESMDEGSYEYEFDATVLSSGVYFYSLSGRADGEEGGLSSEFNSTRKMMLVR